MTRSRGKKGFPLVTLLVAAVALMVVGQVFFPDQMPWNPTTAGTDTDTGTGIQQTFDNSNDVDIDLAVSDCARPATAFTAADTVWLIKDATTGVWTKKETDTNSATPSLTVSPTTEYKALIYDDGTGYGKVITGTAPYQAETTIAVCLDTVDTEPAMSIFLHDDGTKMVDTNKEPVTSENQTFDLIQYRVSVADYEAYNQPMICFDYNFTNISDMYVRSASSASIPRFLLGTAESCYDITAPTPGVPSTGYIYAKVLTFSNDVGANVTANVYLVDRQWYQNTETGEFELGANINDVSTNVGDSGDSTLISHVWFESV